MIRGLESGQLTERVSLLAATETRSRLGEQKTTWKEVGTYFATVRPTSGNVRDATGELVLTQQLKVWMRYVEQANERMRLQWRGDTYYIRNLVKEYQAGRMSFVLEKLDE